MIDPLAPTKRPPLNFEAGDTVILCEGYDECAVLAKLCENWSRKPRIGVCEEGRNAAEELRQVEIQVRTMQLAAIGLVFDAEKSRDQTTKKLKTWLKNAKLPVPAGPMQLKKGRVGDTDVSTAFLINPHGKKTGTIESYFMPQARASKRWPCIEKLLDCYEAHARTTVPTEKVIFRTFIAHGNGRNTGLNAAFRDGLLDWTHKSLDPMRRFLDLLREASPAETPKPGKRRREATQ